MIVKMHDKRRRKGESIVSHMRKMHTVNIFGEGKNKGPVVFTYGSTTLSVLEAFRYGELQGTVVQPIYLEPFPVWELAKYKDRKAIVVEQSSTGIFANLLKDKAGIEGTWALRRYDGRPFEPTELASELKGVM
jgi:2-oxoglutarate ferredoxin oxidoreductase subunit alpha